MSNKASGVTATRVKLPSRWPLASGQHSTHFLTEVRATIQRLPSPRRRNLPEKKRGLETCERKKASEGKRQEGEVGSSCIRAHGPQARRDPPVPVERGHPSSGTREQQQLPGTWEE